MANSCFKKHISVELTILIFDVPVVDFSEKMLFHQDPKGLCTYLNREEIISSFDETIYVAIHRNAN